MGLTKKEISKAIQRLNTDEYEATVRGFHFFTDRSYLYEEDEAGYCTFVSAITSKDSVAKAILEWFKKYVEAIDDAVRAIDDAVRAIDDATRNASKNK